MIIRKGYKYRLYPNRAEQQKLAVQFGHARFVYNWGLNLRRRHYQQTGKGLSYTDTANALVSLKREDEHAWLKQADSQALQQKLKDLDRAYSNFFKKRSGYPQFKSRRGQQSIRYPQRFKIEGGQTYLPKVGWVRTVFHRPIEGEMKHLTVSKTKSGKYFISIQCVVGMLRNHPLAKSIQDAGWCEFVRQCQYKGGWYPPFHRGWYGCHIEKVERFFPSSRRCHVCGQKHPGLKLSERQWVCLGCGTVHNRDRNAAINILVEVQTTVGATGSNAGGESVRPATVLPTQAVSLKPEAQPL